jgi:hypothetical protein
MERERNHPFKEIFGRGRISIDIDGVISLTDIPVIAKFNKDFGTAKTPLDVSGWNTLSNWVYEEFLKQGLNSNEAIKAADKYDRSIWLDEEIYRRAPLAPGAEFFITRLIDLGIPFDFITSRDPLLTDVTFEYFKAKLPMVSPSQILINSDPGVLGQDFKVGKIIERRSGLHIDDYDQHGRLILKNTYASVILLCSAHGTDLRHPRLTKIEIPGRQANLRDFHKRILLNRDLLSVAQSIDKPLSLG